MAPALIIILTSFFIGMVFSLQTGSATTNIFNQSVYIGTMKITEQLDALYMLGTNPVRFLAVPRLLACFFMLPARCFTAVANIIGICGGMILAIATSLWEVSSSSYWSEVLDFMRVSTFFHGFINLIIAIIACMLQGI